MKKLLTVGFFALLLGTGILSMGLCAALGVEEENVENRTLAPAPVFSLKNLENIPAQTESWLNDHAPFRSRWLDLYAALNLTLFQSVDNPEVIVGKEDFLFYGDKGTPFCVSSVLVVSTSVVSFSAALIALVIPRAIMAAILNANNFFIINVPSFWTAIFYIPVLG